MSQTRLTTREQDNCHLRKIATLRRLPPGKMPPKKIATWIIATQENYQPCFLPLPLPFFPQLYWYGWMCVDIQAYLAIVSWTITSFFFMPRIM